MDALVQIDDAGANLQAARGRAHPSRGRTSSSYSYGTSWYDPNDFAECDPYSFPECFTSPDDPYWTPPDDPDDPDEPNKPDGPPTYNGPIGSFGIANCEREKMLLIAQGKDPVDYISGDCWQGYYKKAWGGADIDPEDLTTLGPDEDNGGLGDDIVP
jgi:hypothetical protein